MLQSSAILRGSSLREVMIRTTVLRALVLTAAFAAALAPVTCLGQNPDQDSKPLPAESPAKPPPKSPPKLPAKATKPLPPELLSLLWQKQMPIHSPILVRVFKEEAELKSGNRTPPAVSRSSRPIRFAGGRAILGRSCGRATVRLRRVL